MYQLKEFHNSYLLIFFEFVRAFESSWTLSFSEFFADNSELTDFSSSARLPGSSCENNGCMEIINIVFDIHYFLWIRRCATIATARFFYYHKECKAATLVDVRRIRIRKWKRSFDFCRMFAKPWFEKILIKDMIPRINHKVMIKSNSKGLKAWGLRVRNLNFIECSFKSGKPFLKRREFSMTTMISKFTLDFCHVDFLLADFIMYAARSTPLFLVGILKIPPKWLCYA